MEVMVSRCVGQGVVSVAVTNTRSDGRIDIIAAVEEVATCLRGQCLDCKIAKVHMGELCDGIQKAAEYVGLLRLLLLLLAAAEQWQGRKRRRKETAWIDTVDTDTGLKELIGDLAKLNGESIAAARVDVE